MGKKVECQICKKVFGSLRDFRIHLDETGHHKYKWLEPIKSNKVKKK